MKNKYLNFISDEHFLNCIANLHSAYIKAKNNISKKSFYSNKVDTIKLTFDSKFNDIDEEKLIEHYIFCNRRKTNYMMPDAKNIDFVGKIVDIYHDY